MSKSPDAFRTISEVADWLGVQAHVLRFWESKFAQVKPIKRAGGRRYYRPSDMLLLGGIKKLLHDDGMTIKGTQKLLREKGVAFVADQSQPLDDLTMAVIDGGTLTEGHATPDAVLSDSADPDREAVSEDAEDAEDGSEAWEPTGEVFDETYTGGADGPKEHALQQGQVTAIDQVDAPPEMPDDTPEIRDQDRALHEETDDEPDMVDVTGDVEVPPALERTETGQEPDEEIAVIPSFRSRQRHKETEPQPQAQESVAPKPAQARPRIVDVPALPPLSEIDVQPALLSALARIRRLTPEHAREIKPHLARLTRLRASMANASTERHKD